jgi:hypothetical protein
MMSCGPAGLARSAMSRSRAWSRRRSIPSRKTGHTGVFVKSRPRRNSRSPRSIAFGTRSACRSVQNPDLIDKVGGALSGKAHQLLWPTPTDILEEHEQTTCSMDFQRCRDGEANGCGPGDCIFCRSLSRNFSQFVRMQVFPRAIRARPASHRPVWCAPTDTVTIAFVIATITAVAVVASWLPAWRASRLDPNVVLRDE